MRLLACLLLSLLAPPVQDHTASDSYLFLTVENAIVHVQWDLALRDLDYAIGIDRIGQVPRCHEPNAFMANRTNSPRAHSALYA